MPKLNHLGHVRNITTCRAHVNGNRGSRDYLKDITFDAILAVGNIGAVIDQNLIEGFNGVNGAGRYAIYAAIDPGVSVINNTIRGWNLDQIIANGAIIQNNVIIPFGSTAPDTTITAAPPALTNSSSATFQFTASEANSWRRVEFCPVGFLPFIEVPRGTAQASPPGRRGPRSGPVGEGRCAGSCSSPARAAALPRR